MCFGRCSNPSSTLAALLLAPFLLVVSIAHAQPDVDFRTPTDPAPAPSVPAAPRNGEPEETVRESWTLGTARATTGPRGVYRLSVSGHPGSFRVHVRTSPGGGYVHSHQFEPPRLVLDFPGLRDRLPDTSLSVERGNLLRVRHRSVDGESSAGTRLTVELSDWSDSYALRNPRPGHWTLVLSRTSSHLPPDPSPDTTGSPAIRATPAANGVQLRALNGHPRRITAGRSDPVFLNVLLRDTAGRSPPGVPVRFRLDRGGGGLSTGVGPARKTVRARTDRRGVARVRYHADTRAGPVEVRAMSGRGEASVRIRLTVDPDRPARLVRLRGHCQRTRLGETIHEPLVAVLRDTHGNPVPGVPVMVTDASGDGLVDTDRDRPGRQSVLTTDTGGRARLDFYRLPPERAENEVRMSVARSGTDPVSTRFVVFGEPRLVSVDLREANLRDVLVTLADLAGWNLSLSAGARTSPGEERTVTLRMREVTPLRVLDSVLDHHDLARVHRGSVLEVVPATKGFKRGGEVLSPEQLDRYRGTRVVTVAYRLQFLPVTEELAGNFSKLLLDGEARIAAEPVSNSLIATGRVSRLKRLREVLERMDATGVAQELRVFELERRGAKKLRRTLDELLPAGAGTVVAHAGSRHLLVSASPGYLKHVESLVKTIDGRNALLEHLVVLDVTGYDAARLARRLNSVLGLRLLSLDRLESVRFDGVESAREFFTRREELDPGSLLRSARIVPLPDLEKIILLAPRDVRETARALIKRIRRTPGRYLTERHWSWIQPGSLPLESVRELVGRFGGVNVEVVHEEWNRLLISAGGPSSTRKIQRFIARLRKGPGLVSDHFAFRRIQLTESLLGELRRVVQRRNLNARLVALPGANSVLYTVPPDRAHELRSLLRNVERSGARTQVVALEHRNARDLSRTLNRIFGSGPADAGRGGSSPGKGTSTTRAVSQGSGGGGEPGLPGINIGYDNATNSVFFTAPPAVARRVRRTIDRLDRWQKQVIIRARLVEIQLAEGMEFRPEYIAEPDGNPLSVGGDFDLPEDVDAGAGWNVGGDGSFTALLSASEFAAALRWLRESDRSRVLTRPVVSALNNSSARLDLSEQRFFEVVERDDEGNPIATTFRPQQANKVLNVTPTITSDSNVIMDVMISNDVFGARPEPSTPFPVSTRETRNSILVKHGQTLVIGGIIQSNRTRQVSGIPGLMDLPWVGSVFRETVTSTVRTELVAFLTPRIMRTPRDLREETETFSHRARSLSPPTVLPRNATPTPKGRE